MQYNRHDELTRKCSDASGAAYSFRRCDLKKSKPFARSLGQAFDLIVPFYRSEKEKTSRMVRAVLVFHGTVELEVGARLKSQFPANKKAEGGKMPKRTLPPFF